MRPQTELPEKFINAVRAQLPQEELPRFLASYAEPSHQGLRVNTAKLDRDRLLNMIDWKLTPVPWIDNGFYYSGDCTPSKHPYYYAGLYYLQEPSAMTPANRLPVNPGDRVLDLCAAPGGKSTELAARLQGEGLLVANDISASRAKGLLKNLELFGQGNILVTCEEPSALAGNFPGYFHKILVDAPCSGEGMFRKDHKMISAWERQGPEFYGKLQRTIMKAAVKMLKPGGMLMYSTCTFSRHEDEDVMLEVLEANPDLHPLEISPYEGFVSCQVGYRIWPHHMPGEGHYLCLLQKDGDAYEDSREQKPSGRPVSLPRELQDFLQEVACPFDSGRFLIREGHVYYMPDAHLELKGLRYLRTGLYLGQLKTKRFEPGQALAMYLKAEDYPRILNLRAEDPLTLKYLKGETIPCAGKGTTLVCVDGYPLGWGKALSGMLKNKYLPGWRINW